MAESWSLDASPVTAPWDRARVPAAPLGVPPVICALWVEGESASSRALGQFLREQGVDLAWVAAPPLAFSLLASTPFDVVVYGLSQAGGEGLAVAQELRARGQAPLIVTGPGSADDKIMSLEAGADDYLAIPFNPRELLARVRAVVRRRRGVSPSGPLEFTTRGLVLKFATREVTVDGVPQQLTDSEYALLSALARHAGRVLTRDQLLDMIKGSGAAEDTFDRAIDVHICRLRTKIERDPRHPRYLKTLRGVGYVVTREG